MTAIRESPLTLPCLTFTPVFNVLTCHLFLGVQVSQIGFSGICLVVCEAWVFRERGLRRKLRTGLMSGGADLIAGAHAWSIDWQGNAG